MDPLYLRLWLFYCGMLLVALGLSKGRFSPAVAFFLTWSVSLGLLSLGSISDRFSVAPLLEPVSTYLLAAGGSFLLGAALAHAVGAVVRRTAMAGSRRVASEPRDSFRLWAVQALSVLALVFTVLHVWREAPDLRAYLNDAASIRDRLTDPSAGPTSAFAAVATYAALAVIPVAAAYWLRNRTVHWWMIIPLLSTTLLALMTVGKFVFIFLGLTFINMCFYHRGGNRASSVRFLPILAVVAVVFCAFLITTDLRGRSDGGGGGSPGSDLVRTMYDYATGYVPAFAGFYREFTEAEVSTLPINADYNGASNRPGNQTFAGIYRLLARFGLLGQSASNRYEGTFNVYTIYRDLITDFGVRGSLGCMFLAGFCVSLLYRIFDLRRAKAVIVLSLLTTQMEFSLTYSLFGLIFYPLVLVLSPLMVKSGGRGKTPELNRPTASKPTTA